MKKVTHPNTKYLNYEGNLSFKAIFENDLYLEQANYK